MSAIAKVKGITVSFPSGDMVVPPLSLGAVERLQDRLSAFGKGGPPDITTAIDVLHTALLRNYPDMTREHAADMIDMGNMREVMDAVMGVSMLKPKEDDTGEAQAVKL